MVFSAAISATLVRLHCPHCGKAQTRARKKKGEKYRCEKCHRLFTAEEGAHGKPKKKTGSSR